MLKGNILICITKWFFSLKHFHILVHKSILTFLYIKQCTIWNSTRWMKIIARKKIDKHWNISLGKITYLSLLSATELMPLMAMSYVLTARQSMHVHKCGDGNGVISSLHTYFKDDFIAQGPTRGGREGQRSWYLPCSDVLFFH